MSTDKQLPENSVNLAAEGVEWVAAYRSYLQFWLNLARSISISDDEAKDVVHGVIYTILADHPGKLQTKEHIRNYVARAVLNRAIELKKSGRKRDSWSEDAERATVTYDSSVQGEDWREKEILKQALLGLEPRHFEIIKLRFYSGLTFEEISRLVGTAVSTLKSRETAALKKIRRSLRKNRF